MNKRSNLIITIVFLGFIFGFGTLHAIIPDKEFSESENRVLGQLPMFSWESLKDGRFTKKFEEYIQDQFPFKDKFVALKSDMERLRLKGENNGVYFGDDNRLLEKFYKPNELLDKNIEAINSFIEKINGVKSYVMIVPTATKIYEDKLPKYAVNYDQMQVIDSLKSKIKNGTVIDVYDELIDKKDEYIYFKTDHHWTMRGAYYAYKELANEVGFEALELDEFKTKIVTNDFKGTFYSKANNIHLPADSMEIFEPKEEKEYKIYYDMGTEEHNEIFVWSHLEKKDKYSLFLDGNHALVDIETNVDNGKKLVVIKDSYAHSLIPFLTNHYEEIKILDLRYFNMDVYKYIQEIGANEVLFLYNIKTFIEDPNIKNIYRE